MKQWGRITGYLFAMLLAFASLQAQAATKAQDREFDHTHTGFPITGVHATTQCETCHVGGVFVGTPRACDGCHAVGKRVVATPKSTRHIVTDAPCETCHFNTSTFYGARFNHGTAIPGQCTNCHNGRIVEGTPRNHPVSPIAGASCDSCHRSSSWLPASWNHTDTASDCSVCHKTGGPGRNYGTGHLPMTMGGVTFTNCRDCHTNYYTFLSAFYNHATAGNSCQNCHGSGGSSLGGNTYTGVRAAGTTGYQTVHAAIGAGNFAAATCQSCHRSIATFLGARYDHLGATNCASCHDTGSTTYGGYLQVKASPNHSTYSLAGIANCSNCHKSTAAWVGSRYDHSSGAACDTCHSGHPTWNSAIRQMSANHIPFTAATCTNCHYSSGSTWGMAVNSVTLHSYVNTTPCTTCHLRGNSYSGNGQETKSVGHEGMGAGDDCSKSGCHKPLGGRGVLYQRWD